MFGYSMLLARNSQVGYKSLTVNINVKLSSYVCVRACALAGCFVCACVCVCVTRPHDDGQIWSNNKSYIFSFAASHERH